MAGSSLALRRFRGRRVCRVFISASAALLHRTRPRIVCTAAALLVAGVAFAQEPEQSGGAPISWQSLLAPYSRGESLPRGFRIEDLRRGSDNDVVISVRRPSDGAEVEIHVLPRGQWSGIRESQSFGIGYETASSPAAERETITELLAETIRSRDHGLPSPSAIPLGAAFEPTFFSWWWAKPDVGLLVIQLGWLLLICAGPILCWRAGRALGVDGGRLLIAVSLAAIVALAAVWNRGDEPLHANGHAWREAREVLIPWGGRATHSAPFLHGRGAIALQWLVAGVEHPLTGTANPFRISRVAGAGTAAGTALLVAILVGSPWAGLAAGCVYASLPLARELAVSGSALAVPACILPWSLGLLIAAGISGDRVVLAGAALAAALGTLSHTAMLAWPPAVLLAWLIVARAEVRRSRFALGACFLVAIAWVAQAANCYEMIASRNQVPGNGLLGEALVGVLRANLFLDPDWVSPLLLPLLLVWLAAGARRDRRAPVAASTLALLVLAAPFFAVTACSSDAVRYQGALLGLVASLAIAGLWEIPVPARLGDVGRALLRAALLAALVLLPWGSRRPPTDPAAFEHRLVADAARQIEPGTLVVLPGKEMEHVLVDFPDFLLPAGSVVAFEGDHAIEVHKGPRLNYVGLACVSWDDAQAASKLRPECAALQENTHPWLVRSLRREDLPLRRDGQVWTFHRLATDVPFGFYAPNSS